MRLLLHLHFYDEVPDLFGTALKVEDGIPVRLRFAGMLHVHESQFGGFDVEDMLQKFFDKTFVFFLPEDLLESLFPPTPTNSAGSES